MPTRFDALKNAQGDDDTSSSDDDSGTKKAAGAGASAVPSYEDLSSYRADEETVLAAVYGDDFCPEEGVWGCARLNVNVRPPDTAPEHVGSQFTLSAQLGKKYPYVAPTFELRNVKGLTRQEQQEVLSIVSARAQELTKVGTVMMCEIVQDAEDYLLEHNRDPAKAKMSAWHQMKEREAAEEEAKRKQREQHEAQLRHLDDSSYQQQRFEFSSVDRSGAGRRIMAGEAAVAMEAEKELAKQMETLDAAFAVRKRIRRLHSDFKDEEDDSRGSNGSDEDFIDDFDEEDDAFDDDSQQQPLATSSRYRIDFIELGLLGRGGGGEVVKARNRLDRRIYAIKKIPLESETGQHAEVAKMQNRKLRREVTTISRMTHTNIVRYYQAWVEGGGHLKKEGSSGSATNDDGDDKKENRHALPSDSDSDSNESSGGFWKTSPALGPIPSGNDDLSLDSSSDIDLGDPLHHGKYMGALSRRSESSTSSLLEHEYDDDFKSPLLVGKGFSAYEDFVAAATNRKASSSTPSGNLGGLSDLMEDESSQKVDENTSEVLYIQMEYCSNTLRHLIDDGDVVKMDSIEVWRIARQTVEALAYIHSRKIIHRDLKPGNVFLDSESNVRLGDFGLATLHTTKNKTDASARGIEIHSEADIVYEAIEDISGLLGGSSSRKEHSVLSRTSSQESLTGGVGTTFYRAPEQEGRHGKSRAARQGKDTSYDMKADMYSLGILLFEIFNEPFPTYMERAETLSRLRGEVPSTLAKSKGQSTEQTGGQEFNDDASKDWRALAKERFPDKFRSSAPESAQQIILWCLKTQPDDRPSARELLSSDLLPKKLELEKRYLEEALSILSNPQNESNSRILQYLFDRPTPEHVDTVFDTDVALKGKANSHFDLLSNTLRTLGYTQRDIESLRLSTMSSASCSQLAAILALKRGRAVTKRSIGGGELLRGAPQRTVSAIAAMAASSAAITGSADGVLGADPRVVERICQNLRQIFQNHGAVYLDGPLLRPRLSRSQTTDGSGGPAELMNCEGAVLLLPEDHQAPIARNVGRGGSASSFLKRYTISRVFHRSLAGGHPTEKLEASFDIIYDDPFAKAEVFESELLLIVCQIMASYNGIGTKPTSWFLRLTHTRLADALLDICGVPQKDSARRAVFRILTACTAPSPSSWHNEASAAASGMPKGVDSNPSAFRKYINIAVESHGLPKTAANRLSTLFSDALPLPSDAEKAIERIISGIERIRVSEIELAQNKTLSRARSKRYDDAHRGLRSVRYCLSMMQTLDIYPAGRRQEKSNRLSLPKFIGIDFGLRQKRRNIHGQLLFQAIALHQNWMTESKYENLDTLMAGPYATKVAEGGRYDDLVRRHRPPGNLGSSIPICAGCRFFVGSLVERAYLDSQGAEAGPVIRNTSLQSQIDAARSSLGHPLPYAHPVKCIVASVNGMDSATLCERARVAAQLVREGIPCDYVLSTSGMICSLVHKSTSETGALGSDLSLDEICGIAAVLRIPCIVIVQPHLLKEKGSVRLRHLGIESFDEEFVPLQDLPAKVKEHLPSQAHTEEVSSSDKELTEQTATHPPIGRQSSQPEDRKTGPVDCIYVDEDMYYSGQDADRKKGADKTKAVMKGARKEIVKATQKAEDYLENITSSVKGHGTPVIASALPYFVVREFGTCVMTSPSATEAAIDIATKYPQHKRLLKTAGMSIYHVLAAHARGKGQKRVDILMYSIPDDRFDIIGCKAS